MQYSSKKSPKECLGMEDIREEIDSIDHLVIKLLSKRFEYVKEASKFKKTSSDVQAEERFNNMLEQRKQWASDLGLDGDVIKGLYANLVRYFITEELKQFYNK